MAGQAEVATVVIEGIDPAGDGAGYATLGTRRILIDDVIPGERVEARVSGLGSRGLRGDLVRVLSASPSRVAPMCRHAGACGGCAWQHIAYAEQLRLKRGLVASLLRRHLGDSSPRVSEVRYAGGKRPDPPSAPGEERSRSSAQIETDPAAPRGFRGKVHFVFGHDGSAGGLVMGHYRRRSQEVVAVEECPVHDERGNQVAFAVRDALRSRRVDAAVPGRARGLVRHLVVRVGLETGQRLATLVVSRNDKALRPAVRSVLDGPSAPDGLHVNVHSGSGPFLFGETTLRIHGVDRVRDRVAGVSFLISPTAFFQTNVAAARELVQVVLDHASASRHVLDLYAGAGLFSLPLASGGSRVTAVEENAEAVRDGEASRRLNRIPASACRFVCASVEALASGRVRLDVGPAPDAVILDPPRQGCPRRVLEWLTSVGHPARIVYVSCNPETLAPDLEILQSSGYACTVVQPIDMFPHTPHIETVAVLERVETLRR